MKTTKNKLKIGGSILLFGLVVLITNFLNGEFAKNQALWNGKLPNVNTSPQISWQTNSLSSLSNDSATLMSSSTYNSSSKLNAISVLNMSSAQSKYEKDKSNIIMVWPSDDLEKVFKSIVAGSVLEINEGTYETKETLELIGKNDVIIRGNGNVWIVCAFVDKQVIRAEGCDNLLIKNIKACHNIKEKKYSIPESPDNKRLGAVIDLDTCKTTIIENCELEGCGVYGVYSKNCEQINISRSYIHHNSWRAFGLINDFGVTMFNVVDCRITNNSAFVEKEGNININFEGNNVIQDNTEDGYKIRR